MTNSKSSIKYDNQNDADFTRLRQAKNTVDKVIVDSGDDDSGGGGNGKRFLGVFNSEKLQKLLGKSVKATSYIKNFLARKEGIYDLTETPLTKDMHETSESEHTAEMAEESDKHIKERLSESTHESESDSKSWHRAVDDSHAASTGRAAKPFFSSDIAATNTANSAHGITAQSWVGNQSNAAQNIRQSLQGSSQTGAIRGALTNELGVAAQSVKGGYGNFLETSTKASASKGRQAGAAGANASAASMAIAADSNAGKSASVSMGATRK